MLSTTDPGVTYAFLGKGSKSIRGARKDPQWSTLKSAGKNQGKNLQFCKTEFCFFVHKALEELIHMGRWNETKIKREIKVKRRKIINRAMFWNTEKIGQN